MKVQTIHNIHQNSAQFYVSHQISLVIVPLKERTNTIFWVGCNAKLLFKNV